MLQHGTTAHWSGPPLPNTPLLKQIIPETPDTHIAPWHWEGAELQIGALVFNILNHPNLDQPVGDVPNPQFGYSIRTVATPTSIFGSFLGADASPRALQIRAQLRF